MKISREAHKVNKLTKEFLDGSTGDLAHYLDYCITEQGDRSKFVIAGHNIKEFDLCVLMNDLGPKGLNNDVPYTHILDTYELVQEKQVWKDADLIFPRDQNVRLSLDELYEYLFNKKLPNAHTALGDAKANLEILLKLDPSLKHTKNKMTSFSIWLTEFETSNKCKYWPILPSITM